jgi:hypothetical protein
MLRINGLLSDLLALKFKEIALLLQPFGSARQKNIHICGLRSQHIPQ